jgi:hypothetical protein
MTIGVKLGFFPTSFVYYGLSEWGNNDLEWIFLHGCYTTQVPGNLKASPHRGMNGVHLVCGFYSVGTVGYVTARAESIAGFNAAKTAILADTDLATAISGDSVNPDEDERYSVTLRCHDANGEVYYVAFSRTQVTVSSYSDDAILARVETGPTPGRRWPELSGGGPWMKGSYSLSVCWPGSCWRFSPSSA